MKKTSVKVKLLSWIMVFTVMFTTSLFTVGAQEVDLSEEGAEAEIAKTGADDYPYRGQTNSVADKWNFYSLNCTSFCAWRLNNNNGVAFHNHYDNVHWGNANHWDDAARQAGITVNSTPAVGSIAQWNSGTYGHVAWVAQVNGNGTVTIEEYNYPNKYKYNSRTISSSNPDGYIHIKDIIPIPDPTTPPVPPTSEHDPMGHLDGIQGGKGTFQIWGHTFDPDSTGAPNMLHVYGEYPAGDPRSVFLGGFYADMIDRPDVCQAYPQCKNVRCGYHAELSVPASLAGSTIKLYLYAINIDGTPGENKMFCETTVYIEKPDSTPPEFKSCKIASSERTTYRISAVPADDSQVNKVVCATWSLNNNMADLKWQDMYRLSNGEYILDIQRADFMASQNSVYVNDVYLYYKNGQEKCVRLIQDYRLSEKSAKLFADGEYRIVSALDKNMGLDITGASKENGANVQLYKNTSDKTQTFQLTYTDDGYYKIRNTNSGKLIDVLFDTYQPNTTVSQSDDNGGDNQKWLIYAVENNKFCIKARSNGLALSVANVKAENGSDVRVETYKGINSQHWYIKRVIKDNMVKANDISYVKGNETPKADVTVTVDGKRLTEGVDYTADVQISGAKGTVTITGIGDYYCDSVTKEFSVRENEPPTQALNKTNTFVLGDVDLDNTVTIIDATCIQRYLVNIPVSHPEAIEIRGDINDDGLNILDVTLIQRFLTMKAGDYPINSMISRVVP